MPENQGKNSIPRPPIVVVMGHVDHGKTTLLDFIRKTNLASKEAGGITQSIGAYEIIHADKKITFVDTPGHEAFSKMRARGAKLADLGILVVAADEGVKPQTKEAIEVLKTSETPYVVAINKIDKNNSDIEKTKNDLMQVGVLLEGYGGNISWQAVSAKTGEGVNELLDFILLSADMEELTYDADAKAKGIIIESRMDNSRGLTIAAIVKNGVLRVGDEIISPSASGKVKILEDFLGKRVNELHPSSPALILGFEKSPQIGEEFWVGKSDLREIRAQKVADKQPPILSIEEVGQKINLVIKADVGGSLEAVSEIIRTIPDVKIVSEEIGDITDGDIRNALNNKAVIIGFKVKITKAAENLAKAQEIKIITSDIIYELVKNVEDEIKSSGKLKISAELEILAVFGKKNNRQIVGGRVNMGSFKNNLPAEIKRQEQIIGKGRIINLQCGKQDVKGIKEGEECGMLVEADVIINVGDKLIC